MTQQAQDPVSERPPATSDFVPAASAGEQPELAQQTQIGKFKINTDTLRAYTMLFALIAIWVYFHYSATDPQGNQIFLDPRNFSNLMRQTAVTGVLAVGMLMVIITGQIDLSVGSLVGLAGGIAAIAQGWFEWGLVPSLAAGIGVGIAGRLLSGCLDCIRQHSSFHCYPGRIAGMARRNPRFEPGRNDSVETPILQGNWARLCRPNGRLGDCGHRRGGDHTDEHFA